MLVNLAIGLGTMAVCLALQLFLFIVVLRYYAEHGGQISSPSLWQSIVAVNQVMFLLVAGNLCQVGIWALVFMWLGEFAGFADAFYHSAVNFGTLGYGDVVMSEGHRLLGPLEAINGVLMIGVCTAALMSATKDILLKTRGARRK